MNTKTRPLVLSALTLALTAALSACGGGGGGSTPTTTSNTTSSTTSSSTVATTIPAGTTQATPTYAQGSVQLAMFNQINTYRQQCGFPAVQQNTLLDQAAQNHAQYMVQNGYVVTDDEVQGKPGFTGVTGQDRADALGWPSGVYAGAADVGWYQSASLTNTQWGQLLVNEWATGVYHQSIIVWPFTLTGLGVVQSTFQGYPDVMASAEVGNWNYQPTIPTSQAPLTFPCQGVSGLPYGNNGEIPMPPNASSNGFGTPVTVIGNPSDTVTLTSGSMVNTTTGATITLNVLNAASDPNQGLLPYQASAYPTSPLSPNTTYQVNLSGTINGQPFTRSFTFTTGNVLA